MGFYGKKVAFIIGNGESRKPIDLNFLREKGIIFGCNALYRDFYPDVLISLDEGMTQEILDAKYIGCHFHRILTKDRTDTNRLDIIDQTGKKITQTKGWSSGATAAFIASSNVEFKDIYLIGFDVFKTNKINNIYKDTKNYAAADALAVPTTQFRDQLGRVMKNAPFKKFHWVNNISQSVWLDVKNCDVISVKDFKEKFGC